MPPALLFTAKVDGNSSPVNWVKLLKEVRSCGWNSIDPSRQRYPLQRRSLVSSYCQPQDSELPEGCCPQALDGFPVQERWGPCYLCSGDGYGERCGPRSGHEQLYKQAVEARITPGQRGNEEGRFSCLPSFHNVESVYVELSGQ